MAGISSKAANIIPNKDKTFQGQKFDDDLGINYVEFKYRNHDPQIGRFIEIDPLADKYTYNSTYAFSEDKVTSYRELEGLEIGPILFGSTPPIFSDMPLEEAMAPEEATSSSGLSPEAVQNMNRGNKTEAAQLAKNGLEKNTKPIDVIDPKTGKMGRTVPDAMKNEGKSTVEIKDVKKQSLTEQLRLQEKFSKDNGFKPELIINEGAKLSKPLKGSTFEIKPYVAPPQAVDKTLLIKPIVPIKIKPVNEN